VDLRGNPGGGIGGLRLMSYLTPGKLPVGYSLTRRRAINGFDREHLTKFGRIPMRKIELLGLALRFAFAEKSIALERRGWGLNLSTVPWWCWLTNTQQAPVK
jgi:hypothetical protein